MLKLQANFIREEVIKMSYRITKQYGRGGQLPENAEFDDINEAKLFIRNKMNDDARLKVKVTYRLFSGMDMLEEFDPETFSGMNDSEGQQQTSNRSGFSPTPLNTAPRPPGSPPNWWNDEDKKDK